MNRTAQRNISWLMVALLPALLCRALIPVGFMPMVGTDGALEMSLCPGTVDAATFIAAAADPHAHHHGHGAHHSDPCPYASSGTGLPSAASSAATFIVTVDRQPLAKSSLEVFLPPILRTQSPRGPPTNA